MHFVVAPVIFALAGLSFLCVVVLVFCIISESISPSYC
jgi:hypothetical protein